MLGRLYHLTQWYRWADKIQPSSLLLPQCHTSEPGITQGDDALWVSGVPYARSEYVFLAPAHRIEALARTITGRGHSMAVLAFPIDVLEGRQWIAVEHGRRRARCRDLHDLAANLGSIEMVLTPDPIPLSSATVSRERGPWEPEDEGRLFEDNERDDVMSWLADYWRYSTSMD